VIVYTEVSPLSTLEPEFDGLLPLCEEAGLDEEAAFEEVLDVADDVVLSEEVESPLEVVEDSTEAELLTSDSFFGLVFLLSQAVREMIKISIVKIAISLRIKSLRIKLITCFSNFYIIIILNQ
jgi:hypothetical protein